MRLYVTLHVNIVAFFDRRHLQFAAQFQVYYRNICEKQRHHSFSLGQFQYILLVIKSTLDSEFSLQYEHGR